MRGRLTIYFDVEVENPPIPDKPFDHVQGLIDTLFEEEHQAQILGREKDPQTDRYLYGLALRLPGNFLVTAHETQLGYDEQDQGIVGGTIPKLRVIKGDA
jgi:hypothetical protein